MTLIMKIIIYVILLFTFTSACSWQNKWVKSKIEKKEDSKKAYFLGYNMGHNVKTVFKDKKDQKIFLIGVYHSIKDKEPLLKLEKSKPLQNKMSQQKKESEQKGKSMEEGKKFLEENKKKSGVKETASGLQYKVLKEGSGKKPSVTDNVEVHYRGTLIDGTEFDSSYKRNQTVTFPLNGVIKGWTEGLQLMKEGSKYEFYIPSDLAYGASGTPGIPPHSTLVFEVELIKVK